MKHLITFLTFSTLSGIALSQPDITLWVAPDGYHDHHDHSNMVPLPCDSSYYLFYSQEPGIIPIAIKNEGSGVLVVTDIITEAIEGASISTNVSFPQLISAGEVLTVDVNYQLPSEYVNGINGSIAIQSNDPDHGFCTVNLEVGIPCSFDWVWDVSPIGDYGSVNATCTAPSAIIRENSGDYVPHPIQFVGRDSFTFHIYDTASETSSQSMRLIEGGAIIPKAFLAGFEASTNKQVFSVILNENGTGDVMIEAETDIDGNVLIQRNLAVDSSVYIDGTLQVEALFQESDINLKKDISPIKQGVQKIMQLQPYSYFLRNPKSSADIQYGFTAQQIESVMPELVHTNDDELKSVNYIQIIPWLTAALQEQNAKIQELEHELQAYREMERRFENIEAILEKNGLE